jgi:hypothetical protein
VRAALVLDALGREPAELLHPARQLIARPLELLQAEQAWPHDGAVCGAGRADVREPAGHDRRQLALEPSDLRPQRAPRGALTGPDAIIPRGGLGELRAIERLRLGGIARSAAIDD